MLFYRRKNGIDKTWSRIFKNSDSKKMDSHIKIKRTSSEQTIGTTKPAEKGKVSMAGGRGTWLDRVVCGRDREMGNIYARYCLYEALLKCVETYWQEPGLGLLEEYCNP